MSLQIENAAAPAAPGAGTELFCDATKRLSTIDDGGIIRLMVDRDSSETLTNKTLTSPNLNTPTTTGEVLAAGTATVAPLKYTSGTNLTSPAIGATEFDGAAFYDTIDVTSGRAQRLDQQIFRLTADGSAIGAGIADYFGATSAFPTVLNGIYLLEFHCYFLKSTAGTLTWTLTHTQTLTNLDAFWLGCVITGFAATGATSGAGVSKQTTAATALPVTGSLTTAVDHYYKITAIVQCATAGNIRLRVTNSAGTVTPRQGSYYTATRLSAGNVGTFVA